MSHRHAAAAWERSSRHQATPKITAGFQLGKHKAGGGSACLGASSSHKSSFLQCEQSSPQLAGREINGSTGAHTPPLATAKRGVINSPPCPVTAAAALTCGQLLTNDAGRGLEASSEEKGGKVK